VPDTYRNFDHLAENEIEGQDYEIEILRDNRNQDVVVLAPHGGGIEPYTAQIAREIAGDDLVFYAFKGIKRDGNGILHITSTRFDEPRALALVRDAWVSLSVHGSDEEGELVSMGGRHRTLVESLEAGLRALGYDISDPPVSMAGQMSTNICNRCRGGGAQLELSPGLRRRLRRPNARIAFVDAVRSSLREIRKGTPRD
jgi:phage replication-related protein YjqB (UPF0714/DUF867 family)